MKKFTIASIALVMSGAASAKLPPPPPQAQAAAAAAKEKAAWSTKVADYQLCLAQDKAAKHYFKTRNTGGKPSGDFPACANPGPLVPAQAAAAAPPAKK